MPTSISSDIVTSLPSTSTTATIRMGGITVRAVDADSVMEQQQPATSSSQIQQHQSPQHLQTTFPMLNQRPKSPELNFARMNEDNRAMKIEPNEEPPQRNGKDFNIFSK